MRAFLIILISTISINLLSQDVEHKVCECIENNFRQIGSDYFQILGEIEEDLISNNIIQKSATSRIEQIEYISHKGFIEKPRSYENILFEQLGLKTVKYCIELHRYGSNGGSLSKYFKLMAELENLSKYIQKPMDLNKLKKETAKTILKYQDNDHNSRLWKLIQLEYLYLFTETTEGKGIFTSLDFAPVKTDKEGANVINIHVNASDQVYFNNKNIEKDKICEYIKIPIEQGYKIHFTNEINTKYKLYLEVYNSIKECIKNLRNDKSMELYNQDFESLNQNQQDKIKLLIPMKIFETSPN